MTIRDILDGILDTPIYLIIITIITGFIVLKILDDFTGFMDRFKFIKESFWLSTSVFAIGTYILIQVWIFVIDLFL